MPSSNKRPGTLSGVRRLLEHTSQVHGGGLGRASPRGGACGLDQSLHDPLVRRRIAEQQMLRDAFVGARARRQQARRRPMPTRASPLASSA